MDELQKLASRFGLSIEELGALLAETDHARGMVEPAEVQQAIAELIRVYLGALGSAASRFVEPSERAVAERVASLAGELLAEQLGSAGSRRN